MDNKYAPNGPRTKDLNYDRIGVLLHIIDLSNPTSRPTLKAIHDVAMGELEDIAVEAQAVLKAWAEEAAEQKAAEEAKRAAAYKREVDALNAPRPRSIPAEDHDINRRV